MEILIQRRYKKEAYTIGKMLINGEYFCDTLEDKDRGLSQSMQLSQIKKLKVYGKTAIPTGEYSVKMTLSPHFNRVLPLVENVKGFDGIRIHNGQNADHSLGCILVGKNKIKGGLIDSRLTIDKLVMLLNGPEAIKEPIKLKIV